MSATDNLNGAQFPLFHGTGHAIQGDHIESGREIGHSQWRDAGADYGERSDLHAWAAPDERLAWGYAVHSSKGLDHTDPANRARVHEVRPNADTRKGSTHTMEESGFDEYYAPRFEKTGVVHDIMPGRQGTFPGVNWKQFEPSRNHSMNVDQEEGPVHDVNHPDHPRTDTTTQYEIPNMRPKSHPTLPLGDVMVKQWDGKMARQSVDEAVHDRTALHDRPHLTVTPGYSVDPHREKYPHGVVTVR